MARKGQLSIQDTLENNEDFEAYIQTHFNILICMEVYSDFCGYCLATGNAIRKGKLEIGQDQIAMAKALSDNIDVLSRFRDKSEPVFLFIMKGKLTRAVFGANGIELCRVIEEELVAMKKEKELGIPVPKIEIGEMLPEEAAKIEEDRKLMEEHNENQDRLRSLTMAARKKRVCERMSGHLQRLNFIMFWPHCHQAHYDLYEKWDYISITVAAKETFQLSESDLKEALYMSDVDLNEACVHSIMNGEVMVVLFKMFDTDDRDFVQLMRYALYEEIPTPKDDVPPEKQVPPVPAFERYASISKTAREVRRERYNLRMQKLREEREERERLAAEQARLVREAEEERIREEKKKAEEERMARIAAGLPAEPEAEEGEGEGEGEGEETEKPETEATEGTEASELAEATELAEEAEKVEEEEAFHSDIEMEDEEYIPPGGLFVPGLYCPPNELAKSNGIAFFYPKIVEKICPIETEHLPPHVLVMFTVEKRHEVIEAAKQIGDEIIHMGFFLGEDPFNVEHVAYSLKQYDAMVRPRKHKDRLALMVSRKRSIPMLHLAGYNPCYISSDVEAGERDCLALFPVGYGDEFVDEESVKEEEIVEEVAEPTVVETTKVEEKAADEEEENEEDEG